MLGAGIRIADTRCDHRLTVFKLASRPNINATRLRVVERGKGKPSLLTLVRSAGVPDVDLVRLVAQLNPAHLLIETFRGGTVSASRIRSISEPFVASVKPSREFLLGSVEMQTSTIREDAHTMPVACACNSAAQSRTPDDLGVGQDIVGVRKTFH